MPILLLFLLAAACLPIDWPAPPFGLGPAASAGLTAAAVLVPLAIAFALRTWVVRTLRREPDRRVEVGRVYSRLRHAMFFVNLGAVLLAVLGLGWGATAREILTVPWHGESVLAPFAELAVPLPYFLIVFGCWLIHYDAERTLHRLTTGGGPFWSRAGYFLHHFRQMAFLLALPIGLFVSQQSLLRFAPETASSEWVRGLSVAAVPLIILLMPLLVKPLLGLRSLPPGPVRDRIEALARRLHFRFADLLVWPTHGFAANAMIVGLLPRVRYVIFTDRVLDEMPADELDAVFGHEVGHARHGHIWYYALFLTLSLSVLAGLFLYTMLTLEKAAKQNQDAWYARLPEQSAGWLALVPVAMVAGYIFVVFGFLSRRCERQADVFGCRAGSCDTPGCTGHDDLTRYPERGDGLCATGIRTCARALERVYYINGYDKPDGDHPRSLGEVVRAAYGWLRAWQHAPIPRRVGFLLSLVDDRTRERRFQRRVLVLRWALVIGLTAALVALGEAVGWRHLLLVL